MKNNKMVSKFKQGKNKENLLKKKCPLNNLLRKSIKEKLSKLVKKQKSYDGKTEIIQLEVKNVMLCHL